MKNKKRSEELFRTKLKEFSEETDLNKFLANNMECKFSDGTIMSCWYHSKKRLIMSSSDELCLKIKEQYYQYYENGKKNNKERFEEKLKEFLNEKDLNKFNAKSKNLKFKDGTIMFSWYNLNLSLLKSRNIKELNEQYEEYIRIKNLKVQEQYKEKLKEFISIQTDQKFTANRELLFEDGTMVYLWFNNYKKEILSSKEDLCIIIQKQYIKYQKKQKNNKENAFKTKMIEFLKEQDETKFLQKNKSSLFSDNTYMAIWFYKNKSKIYSLDNAYAKEIVRQHKCFLNSDSYKQKWRELKKPAKDKTNNGRADLEEFKEKTEEFLAYKSIEKFKERNKKIKFKDGVQMGAWFQRNKKKIIELNDETCIQILEQFEILKNGLTFIEYSKEFVDSIDDRKFLKRDANNIFSDGRSMNKWFYLNKEKIQNSDNDICLKIIEQYEKYQNSKSFDFKKKQFLEEKNPDKYFKRKTCFFEDNKDMLAWFSNNSRFLRESKDELSIKILLDYYKLKENEQMIKYYEKELKGVIKND